MPGITREEYMARKLAGICVQAHCKSQAGEAHVRCDKHAEKMREASRRWWREHADKRVEYRKRLRKQRTARRRIGQCYQCSLPAVTRTRCAKHRQEHNDREAARRGGRKLRRRACAVCGVFGHLRPTCPVRAQIGAAPLAAYATARIAWEP